MKESFTAIRQHKVFCWKGRKKVTMILQTSLAMLLAMSVPHNATARGRTLRTLQTGGDVELCPIIASVNTTYTADIRATSHSGLMFQFFNNEKSLELLTLEFDARLEHIDDYMVEIYASTLPYDLIMEDESSWELHARTLAVPSPEGAGLIIPQLEFTPIKIGPRERWSIYIAMKGPWIKNNANALVKQGETGFSAQDFTFFAGDGLKSRFGSEVDLTVHPQFAGVFHYRKITDCSKTIVATTVEFQFLIGAETTYDLLSQVSAAVNEGVEDYARSSPLIQKYAQENGFQQTGNAISDRMTYQGTCPSAWETCAENIVNTKVSFLHTDEVDSGRVVFELQRDPGVLTRAVIQKLGLNDVAYVGLQSAWADFAITLDGVGQGEMTEIQQDFFEETTTRFLNQNIAKVPDSSYVYSVVVKSQKPANVRRLRQLEGIEIRGIVYGSQSALHRGLDFPTQLEAALSTQKELYQTKISYDLLIPKGADDNSIFQFFANVSKTEGSFLPRGPVVEPPTSEKGMSSLAVILICCISGFFLLVTGLICGVRWRKERAESEKELQEYREKRKAERSSKRFQKSESYPTDSMKTRTDASDESDERDSSHNGQQDGHDDRKTTAEDRGIKPPAREKLPQEMLSLDNGEVSPSSKENTDQGAEKKDDKLSKLLAEQMERQASRVTLTRSTSLEDNQGSRNDSGGRNLRPPPRRSHSDDGTGHAPATPRRGKRPEPVGELVAMQRSLMGAGIASNNQRPPSRTVLRKSVSDFGDGKNSRSAPRRSHSDDSKGSNVPSAAIRKARNDRVNSSEHSRGYRPSQGQAADPRRTKSHTSGLTPEQRTLFVPQKSSSRQIGKNASDHVRSLPMRSHSDNAQSRPSRKPQASFDDSPDGGPSRPSRRPRATSFDDSQDVVPTRASRGPRAKSEDKGPVAF